MRKVFFIIAFGLFFSLTITTAQSGYSYEPQGTRFLVGKERAYYGSQKVPGETGPFFKKINSSEETQNLGEIFPQIGLNGRGLFLNFSPNGMAHICELEGTTKVVRSSDGKIYATVCGNLLVFLEAYEGEKTPEKVLKKMEQPAPKREWVSPENKLQNPPQEYVIYERMPPGENFVYVREVYTYARCSKWSGWGGATGKWKRLPQSEAAALVDQGPSQPNWEGKIYYWREFSDADYADFGIHKEAYQNQFVRMGYR